MDLSKLLRNLLATAAITYLDEQIPPPKAPPRRPQPRKSQPRRGTPVRSRSAVRRTPSRVQPYTRDSEGWIQLPSHHFEEVPKEIRQMRTISGYSVTGQRTMEALFCQQGRYMVDFTDSYDAYVSCTRSLPMYYNLKDAELRCYFTWRTRYKLGGKPATETAYLMLYAYEILNQIGVPSPQEGRERLLRLAEDYGAAHPALKKAVQRWMPDYAAYYGIPYDTRDPKEIALAVLLRHTKHTDLAVLSALNWLSKYKLLDSKLYAEHKEDTAAALHAVYKAMMRHYAEQKHYSYPVFLFGETKRESHVLFEGAVFYDAKQDTVLSGEKEYSVRLSPMTVYHCYREQWAVERYCSHPDAVKIGAFLRTFDSLMRDQIGFKYPLKAGDLPTGDAEVIREAIGAYFAEKARANAPKIELDAKKLEEIRAAAAHTTDMLTLPEDDAQISVLLSGEDDAEPDAEAAAETGAVPDLPLSAPAMALLLCLLTGESYQPLLEQGHMLSVLVDEINENLYDTFGDTVVELNGDAPELVPDYEEELKGMFEA